MNINQYVLKLGMTGRGCRLANTISPSIFPKLCLLQSKISEWVIVLLEIDQHAMNAKIDFLMSASKFKIILVANISLSLLGS